MKIIIVEDEAAIRDGLEGILKKLSPSYEVVGKAAGGMEGLELVRKRKPDVILLDIRMPDMDGLTMLAQLKREGIRAIALVLTAYSDFSYARQALELGVQSYLLKPVRMNELNRPTAAGAEDRQSASGGGNADAPAGQELYFRQAVSYLRHNYSYPVRVEQLARQIGVSRSCLYKAFLRCSGKSVQQYLQDLRLEEACRLLTDTRRAVTDIAYSCGFPDSPSFCRIFRKVYVQTPLEFRRRMETGSSESLPETDGGSG